MRTNSLLQIIWQLKNIGKVYETFYSNVSVHTSKNFYNAYKA